MATHRTDIISKINFPKAGRYIVAVSGGVDSVSLLDILAKESKNRKYVLVVAHLDHGMRKNSNNDRRFVSQLAIRYQLPFEYKEAKLGAKATEATARKARYDFLEAGRKEYRADGIITAHHLDDVLETAIFNSLRGADRLGLTPLHLNQAVTRPLLSVSRQEIEQYAKKNKLKWREDPTNQDLKFSRNYIRAKVLPQVNRQKFEAAVLQLAENNRKLLEDLEKDFQNIGKLESNQLLFKRSELGLMDQTRLPMFLHLSLKKIDTNLETKQLAQLIHFFKTASKVQSRQITGRLRAEIGYDMLTLIKSNRQS